MLWLFPGSGPEAPTATPFDVRPAVALADARLVAAPDEPEKRREHLRTAEERLEEATAKAPLEPDPWRLLGKVRVLLNHPAQGAEAARKATLLAPTDPRPHVVAAEAALRLGDDAGAEEAA